MKRAAILALALLAAACEDKAAAPAEQGGEAAGEVLGGTISDAMIPLEQLRSEAPLLPRESAAPGRSASGEPAEESMPEDDAAGEAASEGGDAAPAAPAPQPAE